MIDTELKDLIRKAYKAGRRNSLKQDEANLNDFINKHESKLKLFAIPDVSDTVRAFEEWQKKYPLVNLEDPEWQIKQFLSEYYR